MEEEYLIHAYRIQLQYHTHTHNWIWYKYYSYKKKHIKMYFAESFVLFLFSFLYVMIIIYLYMNISLSLLFDLAHGNSGIEIWKLLLFFSVSWMLISFYSYFISFLLMRWIFIKKKNNKRQMNENKMNVKPHLYFIFIFSFYSYNK